MTTLRTARQSDGWWILDVPEYCVNGETCTSCGPYATKADADDDRRGLQRFYRANPEILTEDTTYDSGD
ncbi:MAG: hypothetical protein ACYC3X_22600 [Pirellulaceae bacterium]